LAHRSFNVDRWTPGPRVVFFRRTGWDIKPHNHGPTELLNLLLYFPRDGNTVEQGTLLYRLRAGVKLNGHTTTQEFENEEIEPAAIVPYIPNTLLAWPNAQHTVHGSVEIAGAPARQYLYINSSVSP
jgi:hypothetical protein